MADDIHVFANLKITANNHRRNPEGFFAAEAASPQFPGCAGLRASRSRDHTGCVPVDSRSSAKMGCGASQPAGAA